MSKIIYGKKVLEDGGVYFLKAGINRMATINSISSNGKLNVIFGNIDGEPSTEEIDIDPMDINPICEVVDEEYYYDALGEKVADIVGLDKDSITGKETDIKKGDRLIFIGAKTLEALGDENYLGDEPVYIYKNPKDGKYFLAPKGFVKDVFPIEDIIATNLAKDGKWKMNDKVKDALTEEIRVLLNEYHHANTTEGIQKNLKEFAKNKAPLINLFSKHPNWNAEKMMIVFDQEYDLQKDRGIIKEFFSIMYEKRNLVLKEVKCTFMGENLSFDDGNRYVYTLNDLYMATMQDKRSSGTYRSHYNEEFDQKFRSETEVKFRGKTLEELRDEYKALRETVDGGERYTTESRSNREKIEKFCRIMTEYNNEILDEDICKILDQKFPEVHAHKGKKTTKIVRAFFDQFPEISKEKGMRSTIQNDENGNHVSVQEQYNVFEKNFAKYADTINPIKKVRHTVISLNPVDYLTMSFGSNWSSCQTIDKTNQRSIDSSHNYQGMQCGGCVSYMNDPSTVVMYVIDKDYNGSDYELQPKIQRNLFFVGTDMFVQSRLYPDGRAASAMTTIAQQFREIFQKVMADAINVNNHWMNAKGCGECGAVTETANNSLNYKDYDNYEDCNVSYLKYDDGTTAKNKKYPRMIIGNTAYDTYSGKVNHSSDCLSSETSDYSFHTCATCGADVEEEDGHFINGEWYCEDCCFYDAYNDQWIIGNPDREWVNIEGNEGNGWFNVNDLVDDPHYFYCEVCERWYDRRNTSIYTVEGDEMCENCYEVKRENGDIIYCEIDDEDAYIENTTFIPSEEVDVITDRHHFVECEECGDILLADLDDHNYVIVAVKDGVRHYFCTNCKTEESLVEDGYTIVDFGSLDIAA